MAEKNSVDGMSQLFESISILASDLKTLRTDMKQIITESVAEALAMVETEVVRLRHENESLQKQVKKISQSNVDLKKDLLSLSKEVNHNNQYSRKNSVRIHGVPLPTPVNNSENTTDKAIELINAKMGLSLSSECIEVSHRVGKGRDGKPPAILVKFKFRGDKSLVMASKKKLKGTNYIIFDDLSPENQKLLHRVKTHDDFERAYAFNGSIWGVAHGGRKFKIDVNDDLDSIV